MPHARDCDVLVVGAGPTGVTLVRPDRYIFGTGAPDALARAWRETVA